MHSPEPPLDDQRQIVVVLRDFEVSNASSGSL
jgi:hypothetical protein